jgi:3-phosphoshikimate 1-carboxyvinyltransferase
MAYVCITGNEQSPAALQQRLERVLASHVRVLCEARLDFLDLSPAAAFGFLARLPAEMAPRLILTQRLKASGPLAGGQCGWDIVTWQSWWRDVMALRPWFAVDLDWLVLDRLAGESLGWRGKFRSRHAFFSLHAPLKEMAQMLPELVASAKEHNAGVKIASPVEGARELALLTDLSTSLHDLPLRVAVAMGAAGRPWRWSRLAGDLTYFAAESARATAPGQEALSVVLPYLGTRQRPDLYLLLGDNPDNRYGEERWNRAFLRRGAKARYLNSPSVDEAGASWAENTLHWMEKAQVKGASVTKPYKLSFPSPTNTLKRSEGGWERANTDGAAVARLLRYHGLKPGERVVIAGGGGAAQAVLRGLVAEDFKVTLWVREEGRLGPCPEGEALVSTWPGSYQEALVQAIPTDRAFRVVIDAQFSRPAEESPLAQWSQKRIYVHGSRWWREQARLQDEFWFGPDRLGEAKEPLLALVPNSKSETLRALAISLACGVTTEVHSPAQNDDTAHFLAALEALGVSVDQNGETIRLYPPRDVQAPLAPIHMGEGATGLRMLGALSCVMSGGPLLLSGSEGLQGRPAGELREGLRATSQGWPLEIPVGQSLPSSVSLERSSQFATAFLIAAAGLIYRGKIPEYSLRLEGSIRSEPYLRLTLALLREAGFSAEMSEREVNLQLVEKKSRFFFAVEKDASSLAFLEVFAERWALASFFTPSRQGDAEFPAFAAALKSGEKISLRHHPDLAPPLWALAALLRRRLEVVDCPQLHWKESNRARLLAQAAQKLGAPAEEREDGFLVDFCGWVPPAEETFLRTDGDHRLAMTFGLLATDIPWVMPDRRDCVRKSFPSFWPALQLLEEVLPG